MKKLGLLLWASLSIVPAAHGASFDCKKAKTPVEKMVCADERLSELDERLAQSFSRATGTAQSDPQRVALRREQRVWLKQRDACSGKACLEQRYAERIAALAEGTTSSGPRPKIPTAQAASPRQGDCYVPTRGRNTPLCQEFLRNLNLQCDQPPMVCSIRIHPSMAKRFTLPKWEELDPVEHFDWVGKVYRAQGFASRGGDPGAPEQEPHRQKVWQEMQADVLNKAKAGRLKLSRTRIDVNHNGTRELVYRVDDLTCNPAEDRWYGGPATPLHAVINERTGEVDHSYGYISDMRPAQLLLYKGGYVYLMTWAGNEPREVLRVQETIPRLGSICAYNYLPGRPQ